MTLPAVQLGGSWEHIASRTLWSVVSTQGPSAPRDIIMQRNADGERLAISAERLRTVFRVALPSSELGVYVGGNGSTYLPAAVAVESWLGKPLDFVLAYGDAGVAANTFRFDSSDPNGWPVTTRLALGQPLTAPGWDMAAAAAGAHDATFQTAADNLLDLNVQQRIVDLRIGWEMNGDWYPWSLGGDGTNQTPANYVATFRRLALMVRGNCPNIAITWNPNFDREGMDWYPGDDVVDIIGSDIYVNSAYFADNFDFFRTAPCGLDWLENMAVTRNKKLAIPEWATNYNTANFVEPFAQWLRERASLVAYHAFWDSNDAFPGAFADYPVVQAAYQHEFGNP